MTQFNTGLTQTFTQYTAVTPYTFVRPSTSDLNVIEATDATTDIIGAADETSSDTAGDPVTVVLSGVVKIKMSATCSIGAKITGTTGGLGVATTTPEDFYAGIALEAATAANDVIAVLLLPGVVPTA